MVSLSAIVYYSFLFFGGVGFGYFVMRTTQPDSRLLSATQKLGASALYGFVLFAVAMGLDYYVSGEARFLNATGFLPITLFFTILVSVFVLKIASMASKPKFLVVGVPAAKLSPALEKGTSAGKLVENEEKPQQAQQAFQEITPSISKQAVVETPKLQKPAVVPPVSATPLPLPSTTPPAEPSKIELQFEPRKKPDEHKRVKIGEFFQGIKHALGFGKKKEELKEVNIPEKEIQKPSTKEIAEKVEGEKEVGKEGEKEGKVKQASPEQEFDIMVQEVYGQLQTSKERAEVSDKLKLSPPPVEEKAEQKIASEQKPETLASLPVLQQPQEVQEKQGATQLTQSAPASSSSLFQQLSEISVKPAEKKQEGDVKFVKIPADGAGCPRCHSMNSRIVFCPYCGSGMCANCTPLITPKEDGFDYSCPKCGESIFVKRQTQ